MSILEGDLAVLRLAAVLRILTDQGIEAVVSIEESDVSVTLSGGKLAVLAEGQEDARAALVEMLATRRGRFTAETSRGFEGEVIDADLETLDGEAQEIEDAQSPTPLSAVPVVAVDPDDDELQLSGAELRVLMKIDGSRSVEDITRKDPKALALLRGLVERGLVLVEKEEKEEPPVFEGVACFTIDDQDRTTHLLDGDEYTIGRKPENEIQIDHPSVSGAHAKVERLSDGYRLSDLGSRNGSFVNGQVLQGPRLLADGDRVRLGTVHLVYSVTGAVEEEAGEPIANEKVGG